MSCLYDSFDDSNDSFDDSNDSFDDSNDSFDDSNFNVTDNNNHGPFNFSIDIDKRTFFALSHIAHCTLYNCM